MFTEYKVEDNKDGIETNQNILKNKVESLQHTLFPQGLFGRSKKIKLFAYYMYFNYNKYLYIFHGEIVAVYVVHSR